MHATAVWIRFSHWILMTQVVIVFVRCRILGHNAGMPLPSYGYCLVYDMDVRCSVDSVSIFSSCELCRRAGLQKLILILFGFLLLVALLSNAFLILEGPGA